MKKHFFWLSFLFFIGSSGFTFCQPQCALTYAPVEKEFGKSITTYCKAKYLAHTYKLKFFFVPFKNSEKLTMSQLEETITTNYKKSSKKIVTIKKEQDLVQALINIKEDTLFVCNFETQLKVKNLKKITQLYGNIAPINMLYCLAHTDPQFDAELKTMLIPLKPKSIVLPKDQITVAVHIQKGIKNNAKNQYYIDQIKKIVAIAKNIPLFICIFTNHKNPQNLLQEFKKQITNNNIFFTTKITHDIDSLEGFYAMAQFDCLIRTTSHLSLASAILGNHEMVISPTHTTINTNKKALSINKVDIVFRTTNSKIIDLIETQTPSSGKFKLITTLYNEKNENRCLEFITCIENNLKHPLIETIHVAYDTSKDDSQESRLLNYLKSKKIQISYISDRASYGNLFEIAHKQYPNSKIIISNADIFFNKTLALLEQYELSNKFLALARWNVQTDGTNLEFFPREDAQDVWIFQAPLPKFENDTIRIGLLGCDGAIAYQAQKSNLTILNPSRSIQCCHLHCSNIRNYPSTSPYKNTERIDKIPQCTIWELNSKS